MKPVIITGGCYEDARGKLMYNNAFDALKIRRIYLIENTAAGFIRGWQGHRIEQRWFSAMQGSFMIRLIEVDNWNNPSKDLQLHSFIIDALKMDVLHIPSGYINSIQALTDGARLLVMSDYYMGEIDDEYRFDIDYFVAD